MIETARKHFHGHQFQATSDPVTRLAAAVVRQAVKDSKNGSFAAMLWLASEDAEPWLLACGLEPDAVADRARAWYARRLVA